jgi:tetratricopeptide (TPR) repeat protein
MDALAAVLRVAKQFDRSVEWSRRSLAVRAKLPPDPGRRGRTLGELAKTLDQRGDKEAAIAHLMEAYDLHKPLGGQSLAGAASALVETMVNADRDRDAIPYAREALALRRQSFREDREGPRGSVKRLNGILLRLGEFDAAQELLEEHRQRLAKLPDADENAQAELDKQFRALREAREQAERQRRQVDP